MEGFGLRDVGGGLGFRQPSSLEVPKQSKPESQELESMADYSRRLDDAVKSKLQARSPKPSLKRCDSLYLTQHLGPISPAMLIPLPFDCLTIQETSNLSPKFHRVNFEACIRNSSGSDFCGAEWISSAEARTSCLGKPPCSSAFRYFLAKSMQDLVS